MNNALVLNANTAAAAPVYSPDTSVPAPKTLVISAKRTLARKGEMVAVITLMAGSAAYGLYAITQMTGF